MLLTPVILPTVVPSAVVVPFPSNHSTLYCPAAGATPSILIVIDPLGVIPVQFVLLVAVDAATTGLAYVSLMVTISVSAQPLLMFVASTV